MAAEGDAGPGARWGLGLMMCARGVVADTSLLGVMASAPGAGAGAGAAGVRTMGGRGGGGRGGGGGGGGGCRGGGGCGAFMHICSRLTLAQLPQ